MITQKYDRTFVYALKSLKEIAVQKNKQWETLFKSLENYLSQIAEQEKIITCLEYRHVLEHIPNMTSLTKHFNVNELGSNTKNWGCT